MDVTTFRPPVGMTDKLYESAAIDAFGFKFLLRQLGNVSSEVEFKAVSHLRCAASFAILKLFWPASGTILSFGVRQFGHA